MQFGVVDGKKVEGYVSHIFDNTGQAYITLRGLELDLTELKSQAFEIFNKALQDGIIKDPVSPKMVRINIISGYEGVWMICYINYCGYGKEFAAPIQLSIEQFQKLICFQQ